MTSRNCEVCGAESQSPARFDTCAGCLRALCLECITAGCCGDAPATLLGAPEQAAHNGERERREQLRRALPRVAYKRVGPPKPRWRYVLEDVGHALTLIVLIVIVVGAITVTYGPGGIHGQ